MRPGFFLILLLPLIGQTYVTWHIYQILPCPTWVKVVAAVLSVAAFLSFFVLFAMGTDRLSITATQYIYEIGTTWLIALLYLVMIFLVLDFGRLVHLVPRHFLFNSVSGSITIFVAITALLTYGNIHYRNKVRQPLTIKTEKQLNHPIKAVMLSDLHLGFHNRRPEFARWVDIINAENPDIVLIAGDIIDISVRPLLEENVAQEFRRINAPIYACLGNHEYYASEPLAQQFYHDAGIHLLRDTAAVVGDLCIIGRDDRTNTMRKPLLDVMQDADSTKFSILLDHQPHHLELAEQCGIDFQFSGHTHHGQVWPGNLITEAMYECAFGSHRRGDTQYYVSSGIGIWGGKYRIGTRSEYIVATISN